MSACDPTTPAQTSSPTTINLPAGVPNLRTLYLYIAGSCNLACRHCWITPSFREDGSNGQYMPVEYVEKALDEAIPMGLASIKLTGGEPTLHPRFRDIVQRIVDRGVGANMETNGTLVDESLAEFLTEYRMSFISVSLDGSKPETHDALRSVKGSYDRAIQGIKNLVAVGYHPQMICTLHRNNFEEAQELIAIAHDLGCGSVKFNHVQPAGRGESFGRTHGLTIPEVIEFYYKVERELMPTAPLPIYFDIPPAFRSIDIVMEDRSRCGIVNILGVLSSGDISMCGIGVTVPDLNYGHMTTHSLYDVWCKNANLIQLREQLPDQLEGVCRQCLHQYVCLGHCVAHNYLASQKIYAAHPFCAYADEHGLFPSGRKL